MSGLADTVAAAVQFEGVPSALSAARDGVDSVLRDRGLRRTTPQAIAESLLRGAVASAQLDGSGVTLQEARDGHTDAVLAGALRLYGELLNLVPVLRRAPLQAFARMHALAAVQEPPDRRGRPRADLGSTARLQEVAAWLTDDADVPALARAAVAHGELIVLAPFDTGNGLIARAVERIVLVSTGVDPSGVTVPEWGHAVAPDRYRAAVDAYRSGGPQGQRTWLLHVSDAVTAGVGASPLVS